MKKTREIGLAGILVLATGVAFAQPGVKLSTVNGNGTITSTTVSAGKSGGPGVKAPTPAADGSAKYWDVLGIGGTSTNYYNQVPYITAPPNPQIATGPDDILLVVNRTISRYPNPNAAGNTGTLNPYNYPATELVPLDVWMGLTVLGTQAGGGALCPSGTGSNTTCVIDNASIRYDQLQGRFVVLFTVTDLPAHRSNWVLVVSTFAQFQKCPVPAPAGSVCPTSSPLFTPPVIAPIVGGTQTGGQNAANWVLYKIPINLQYLPNQQPSALGLINNPAAPGVFANSRANSAIGTPNLVSSGGSSAPFLTTPFCANGGPALPLTYATVQGFGGPVALGAGGSGRSCTNYYPTGARFGIDNDNIILTAPVLDQAFSNNEGNYPSAAGQNQGPYAGTRVTTIAKIVVYNGTQLNFGQPGPGGCTSDTPVDCQAVNLSDDVATGTLTEIAQKIAFAAGSGAPAADLQYGTGTGINAVPNSCAPAPGTLVNPLAVSPPLLPQNAPVLSCAPIGTLRNALPAIFWEPDNLRGRALASFDAQVAPFANTAVAGVITPFDYLVGSEITDNFGVSLVPQGVAGVTNQPAPNGTVIPQTAGIATIIYIQPIIFSCPGIALFSGPSGVSFCGNGTPGAHSLVADLPFFGPLRRNASTLADFADPTFVGQGFSGSQMTTNPLITPVSSTANNRLFVGDSRPEQVIFREGLLYVARSATVSQLPNPTAVQLFLDSSTVLYDIVKTCTTGATAPTCGPYSINGGNIGNPALAFEYFWENGISVPDPAGNIPGFGFYQPMFDVPADVTQTGPISPISTLQLFDKLFVGMTTGGTNNTLATFSKSYPSLWDFRPGDDAFDTIEPYLDPYTGNVLTTYNCNLELLDVTLNILAKSGNNITVDNTVGLGVGMFLTGTQTTITAISGNTVTLSAAFAGTSFPASATFTRTQPLVSTTATVVTPGSNQITVSSTAGLAIGQILTSGSITGTAPTGNVTATAITTAGSTAFLVKSATNLGLGEIITGTQTGNVLVNTTIGSFTVTVPNTTQVAVNETVTGTGVAANTAVTNITINADGTLQITLNNALTANSPVAGTNIKFDSTPCFPATSFVVPPAPQNNLTVTSSQAVGCTSFGSDGTQKNPINNAVINNGIGAVFTFNLSPTGQVFPPGTTILNIVGSTVTLSQPAVNPLPGQAAGVATTNVPLNFLTNGSIAQVQCPIIPFSARGGASTDPNDGSMWMFGEFAKNRLSTIPGPGQWGTAVANYALSFPATDPYGNDNTYFQDVQPTGSPDSAFFTWIQLAKNLGLAVPSATGPCTINNGLPPILQPPGSGGTPTPGPSTLGCPYFGPDTLVTRAEMAYWVVKSQMDEAQITNYLCATGGDPSGLSPQCSAGTPASTFADLGGSGGSILNPFLGAIPSLNIAGVTNAQLMRYIEVMARRGYTKGCTATIDPTSAYCPNLPVSRAQMSVFLIRAKMNNVFPTTLSGIPLAAPYGDNFGTYLPPVPYFSDATATDPVYGPYYIYIQKMRELRITNGTGGATFSPGSNLTRKEIAVFVVRAFFL